MTVVSLAVAVLGQLWVGVAALLRPRSPAWPVLWLMMALTACSELLLQGPGMWSQKMRSQYWMHLPHLCTNKYLTMNMFLYTCTNIDNPTEYQRYINASLVEIQPLAQISQLLVKISNI